jgi:hypothetical protein
MFSDIDTLPLRQVKAVRATITPPRMSTYDVATPSGFGTRRTRESLKLYLWNAEVAAAFMVPLHLCEVAVRNAAAEAVSAHYGSNWPWSTSFRRTLPNDAVGYSPRADLSNQAQRQSTTGKVIPEVKFIFWQRLFTSRFDAALWDEQLLRVFPNAPDGAAVPELRERVFGDLEKIRKLRNRIAHHEPIFNRQLEADLAAIHDLLTLRCVTATEVARSRDRVTALLEARPFQPEAR